MGSGCLQGNSMWTFKTELMKQIKPYGGGDLRLNGENVTVMQVVRPELKFKEPEGPITENYNPQHTEEWMNSPTERLNRVSVRILKGTLKDDVKVIFEEKGQDGSWWVSTDQKTIYVSTEWVDHSKIDEYLPLNQYIDFTFFAIYKSTDGGSSFTKLNWPEHTRVSQILFAPDGKKGYAIGGGPSLWRTENGGETWQAIKIPAPFVLPSENKTDLERLQNESTLFDAYHLDKQGTLWLAAFTPEFKDIKNNTLLYQIPWDPTVTDLNSLSPDLVIRIPDKRITDISSTNTKGQCLITEDYNPSKPNEAEKDKKIRFMSILDKKTIDSYYFGTGITIAKLYVGSDNLLYASGFEWSNNGTPSNDLAFVSKDGGKSWDEQNEGSPPASAGYFDASSNIAWRYSAFSLYFRKL
jgi:hypothetical protein